MNRIVHQFHKSFNILEKRRAKGWDKIYVAVDIHETVMEPTWSDELSHKFYKDSLEGLQMLSEREDVCLILWTSSNKANAAEYKKLLAVHGVDMKYINCNPEVADKHYADYETKFYANVMLDDKAGFLPQFDWPAIVNYLKVKKNFDNGSVDKNFIDTFVAESI